jgi:hypothetical protein
VTDKELETLFGMIEDLLSRVRGSAWIKDGEVERIEAIIAKYREDNGPGNVGVLTHMREDLYKLYDESSNRMKAVEKYTPAWENERRMRDMYFKFLNMPILFLIGMRDESFGAEIDERDAADGPEAVPKVRERAGNDASPVGTGGGLAW